MGVMLVACPKCGHGYKIRPERAGHEVHCKCGHAWVVEPPSPPAGQKAAESALRPAGAPAAGEPSAQPAGETPTPMATVRPAAKHADQAARDGEPGAAAGLAAPAGDAAKSPSPSGARKSRAEEEARRLIGSELGNFRIEDLLGVGGFGTVYRAFDKSLHRHVAVKVLPQAMARASKEKIQHFLLEARAAAKLSHPNIVTVHQICQSDGIYFIVMELVEGRSLAELVRARRLSAQEATRIITEATRGLAHAHKRGLIHRDIKPGNIIVTTDGQVKMTDFGLARDIFRDGGESELGRAVGTPLYMSPEQCRGEEGDSRSDVYSMGATYYVALTRRPPYESRETEELMNHHMYDDPPDPRGVVPTLPAAVFRIIEKAMAKEPTDRYQTAEDLLHALEGLDFATLDPNATLSLETVSAQISAVTPSVGSHVGAVMEQALRHADTSTTRSRLLDAIEKTNPARWWILVGVMVALVCIAAVVIAVIVAAPDATASNPPADQLTSTEGGAATATARGKETSDRPGEVGPDSAAAGTEAEAKTADAASEQQPTETEAAPVAQEPEKPRSPEEEMTENARVKYEEARRYEETHWATDKMGVLMAYEYVIQYFGDTPYAERARADLARLRGEDTGQAAEQPAEQPSEETGEQSSPPAADDDTAAEDRGD